MLNTTKDNNGAKKPKIKNGVCYSHGPCCAASCMPPSGVEEIENCTTHCTTYGNRQASPE